MTETIGRGGGASVARGLLLVAIAVAVGVLLLRNTDDPVAVATQPTDPTPGDTIAPTSSTTEAPAAGDDAATETTQAPSTDADDADGTDDAVDSTATTSAETVPTVPGFQAAPANEVSVQVVNSTSVNGAAGRLTDDLKSRGYITLKPTNIQGTALEVTSVHFKSGKLLEAQVIAELLGLDSQDGVYRMLTDTSAIGEFQEPDVLVILGNDIAE